MPEHVKTQLSYSPTVSRIEEADIVDSLRDYLATLYVCIHIEPVERHSSTVTFSGCSTCRTPFLLLSYWSTVCTTISPLICIIMHTYISTYPTCYRSIDGVPNDRLTNFLPRSLGNLRPNWPAPGGPAGPGVPSRPSLPGCPGNPSRPGSPATEKEFGQPQFALAPTAKWSRIERKVEMMMLMFSCKSWT